MDSDTALKGKLIRSTESRDFLAQGELVTRHLSPSAHSESQVRFTGGWLIPGACLHLRCAAAYWYDLSSVQVCFCDSGTSLGLFLQQRSSLEQH